LPSTSLTGTALNEFLAEYTPSNRVLTGEVIVFQNEIIEIFKELIAMTERGKEQEGSPKPKYVSSVMIEFFHALMENNIPQQSVLQTLLIKYIVEHRDFNTFHLLLQYHVLTENLELARILITIGTTPEPESGAKEGYYEPALQAGLDMLKKLKSNDEIVVALINEGLTLRALNFAFAYNVHSMKLSSFLECVERLKEEGKDHEADVLFKRITEVRKFDAAHS
jgi:hypothetical protein